MDYFTVGPVNMFDYTLRSGAKQVPYFRNAEFSQICFETENMVKDAFFAPANSKLLLLTMSGSGAMEAAVKNCCNAGTYALVINGGTFGQRFCDICKAEGIPFTELKIGFDENLTEELLQPFLKCNIDTVLVNIHETSLGKLYDKKVITEFVKKTGAFLICDAISSFLADEINLSEFPGDVTIFSSQKALALAPGLSGAVLSERAVEKIHSVNYGGVYMNFTSALKDMERGQTPFTPAVGIIYDLHERLTRVLEKGVAFETQRCRALALAFRGMVKEFGYSIPSYALSDCLTPIVLSDNGAKALQAKLMSNYGVYVTPCGGEHADSMLRVGHIGNITKQAMQRLLEGFKNKGEKKL